MSTMQHKNICVREFIKTESATDVQRAFRFVNKKIEQRTWNTATNCLLCVEAPFTVQ